MKTHRIIDEIEKIEIEHYLNEGENPLNPEEYHPRHGKYNATSSIKSSSDHPRHKIDPALEEERLSGNYKFEVCPSEK